MPADPILNPAPAYPKMDGARWVRAFATVSLALTLSACLATERDPFTVVEQQQAAVAGYPSNIRIFADETSATFERMGFGPPKTSAQLSLLSLSGGGSGGAFGAGLLTGWTASGSRPTFDLVSGVSTGALIAPFAFLGPAYDDQLRYLYTSGVTDRLVRRKPLPVGLLGSGVYRSQPLRDLVDANITEDLLARIASEHIGGRRLLVVTMNVDAQRPVVWDLGRIAASANPSRRELLVDILVASASVPGAFAPVPIQVLANGRAITELHADAGPATQIFTVPEPLLAGGMSSQLPAGPRTMLYAIVNSVLMPEFEIVPDTTFQTAGRGLETLIKTQRRLTIEATQAFAERSRIRFRYASINEPVPGNSNEAFDLEYMRNLFRFGLERGRSGQLWDDTTTPGTPSAGASPR